MTRNESYSKIRHHVDGHIDKLLYKVARPHKTDIENKRNLEVESVEVESVEVESVEIESVEVERVEIESVEVESVEVESVEVESGQHVCPFLGGFTRSGHFIEAFAGHSLFEGVQGVSL